MLSNDKVTIKKRIYNFSVGKIMEIGVSCTDFLEGVSKCKTSAHPLCASK